MTMRQPHQTPLSRLFTLQQEQHDSVWISYPKSDLVRKCLNGHSCSIWSNASIKGRTYTKKTLSILQSIQARAARAICGAFKATSKVALDIEAYLVPIEQQIWGHNADVIIRLLSCKDIADIAGFQTSRSQATIANNIADKARGRHDREHEKEQSLSIYTDGSGIDGDRCSGSIPTNTADPHRAHRTRHSVSTVYATELQGISLALQIARQYADRGGRRPKVDIYTDNQAAIWSIAKAEGRSGAYILEEIARQLLELRDMGQPVTERKQQQAPTSRHAVQALATQIDLQKMMQNTNSVENQMANGDQGSSNVQTHTDAHQEGAPPPRGA
ncbi:hypothetical protein IQ07DRAFT_668832 [Pyrenochaeta sp. DS3sAY3a]|nr:hypothetical protein IQ07DRAFT_668832 [Pyrenochaeta sp. DS3sAY3a]